MTARRGAAPPAPSRRPRTARLAAQLLALALAIGGCQDHEQAPSATQGPLIAYTIAKTTPWFQEGDASFVLAQGQTSIKTWTKHVQSSRFGGFGRPAFTTDGKHVFAQYADEQVGRYPYDGGDIHAELAWIDVPSGHTHEVAIPARSRISSQPPGRPGEPYALHGSAIVWQGPTPAHAADNQVLLMQLDLSAPNPMPTVLRTVVLPPRTPEQAAVPYRDMDFTGNVVGAGHGRVVVAKKYGSDPQVQADRLFLVDTDGTVRDLANVPTSQWVSATFSPDGTRIAYETGRYPRTDRCGAHQVSVFDAATGRPAPDFPPGPFDATPRPYFYGNTNAAVWWTTDGKLRAAAGADKCPANPSEITPDGGVWELRGAQWAQVDPPETYRDYPTPNGDVLVISNSAAPTDAQHPDQKPTGTGVFIRNGGQLIHIADARPGDVAVPPT